ncbi:MAG: serine/threonine-protein kinase [Myxococcota bacterium]
MPEGPPPEDGALPERPIADSLQAAGVLAKVSSSLFGTDDRPQFGRFTLLDQVGAGAMGTVYSAFDPELDRKIAIKLLHGQLDESPQRARARLLREARALAKLTHPNVATVYEGGHVGERVFIAMEFVDGQPLDAWMEGKHPWREVVSVFRDAGAGLAAAHAAGIVHRDFKPSNVMRSADGRVVVLDFGLAALDATTPTEERQPDDGSGPVDRLTASRAVVGTPAYMAPEQHRGEPATASSDQFAFCVSLFEALYGTRPFKGTTRASVLGAIEAGEIAGETSGGSGVAPRIRRVVLRGLSPEPEDRYPTMEALLIDLDLRRVARRRAGVIGAVGGVVALTAAYRFGAQGTAAVAPVECASPQTLQAEVWDAPHRARVLAAYAEDPREHVRAMAEPVLGDVDQWAQHWSEERAAACRSTRERGEQSEELLQVRLRCYDAAAIRLHALADTLVESDDDRASARALLSTLPVLTPCSDAEWLERNRHLPAGEDGPARLVALQEASATARLAYHAGRLERARTMYTDALQEARALQHGPSEAVALYGLARIDYSDGKVEQAAVGVTEAMTKWIALGDEFMAAEAALELMSYFSADASNPAERQRWSKVAEGLIAKLGSPPDLEGRLHIQLSGALGDEGDAKAALEHARTALALYETVYGERHSNVADAHDRIGRLLQELGRSDEGLPEIERALAIETDLWGPDHPRVAASRVNLGVLYATTGRVEDSARELETALSQLEAIFGPESHELSSALTNLGETRMMQDRPADALALNERAGRLNERVYGPDHPEVAFSLSNGAAALVRLQRYDEAEDRLRRALRIRKTSLGADHPYVGLTQFNLGAALAGKGDHPAAVEALSDAERIWSAQLGDDHPNTAAARVNLGESQVAAGQREEGLAHMRAGVEGLVAALGPEHPDVAVARSQLAAVEP